MAVLRGGAPHRMIVRVSIGVQVGDFVKLIRSLPEYAGQIVHEEGLPARPARYRPLAQPLPPPLQKALARLGAPRFYAHQAEAIDAAREGRHVMVSTGTSSGKKLRLKGQGVQPTNGSPGDLLAEIQIVLPPDLVTADRKEMETILNKYSDNPRADLRW